MGEWKLGSVFVIGATSTVGSQLLPILRERGIPTLALGRTPVIGAKADDWHFLDLADQTHDLPQVEADALVHTANLWLLPDWIDKFHARGVRRVIAFSSTSRFTKKASSSPYELAIVDKIVAAEESVAQKCARVGIAWTIFRPTLIYGGASGDRNVSDIARLVRKLGVFPLFGAGTGLRQPVHARDLAIACAQSLTEPASYNKSYNLSGGETLSYANMVQRIFETLERRPRFIHVPLVAFAIAVRVARLHPQFAHLTLDMALRMKADLSFDHSDAKRDFGYAPGSFDPEYLKDVI